MSGKDGYAPLTSIWNTNGDDDAKKDGYGCKIDQEEDVDDEEEMGYSNYKQPNIFRRGRYSGYSTLGRVPMHDSLDFDYKDCDDDDADNDYDERIAPSSMKPERWPHASPSSPPIDDEEDENGDFVSFWRHGGGESCCSNSDNPQHYEEHSCTDSGASGDYVGDDRIETTVRPIPLFYRKYQGGLSQNALCDSASWFQRERGLHPQSIPRRINRPWGLRRSGNKAPYSNFGEFDNSEDNSLLDSSSEDENGHYMPTPMPTRALSPFRNNRLVKEKGTTSKNHMFGKLNQRGQGILSLPIIRPFLRGSRRGFTDDTEIKDDDDIVDDYTGGTPSRQDRVAVVKSISRGIAGTNDESLVLDSANRDIDNHLATRQRPNILERIFSSRFLQRPEGKCRNSSSIIQLHNHIRKEDWSLATALLESNPGLAQTWHPIDRLYGGRYGGEALPLHAACALRPPSLFIKMLATLYPEGLLQKDKAFGRVPLHVACRSLANSSVIRVLCEMDPRCIEERDTLKRTPLHYLIKNYSTFGEDDDDISIEEDTIDEMDDSDTSREDRNKEDGIIALKRFVATSPNCVRAADHRGWLPLHVACSCSSRKGMIRVMRLLLKLWPESIGAKTDKDSDAFACVDMAGKHHPTKEKVISLLKEAKGIVDSRQQNGNVGADNSTEGEEAVGNRDEIDDDQDDSSLPERSIKEDKSTLPYSKTTSVEHYV